MTDKTTGLYPDFADRVREFIVEANYSGFNIDIFSGYRSVEEQAKLYAKGRTAPGQIVTNSKPGYSWHSYGLAVDVVNRDNNGDWNWFPDGDDAWQQLADIADKYGLDWGGNFRTIKDWDHWEKDYDLTLEECIKFGTPQKVWAEIDRRIK